MTCAWPTLTKTVRHLHSGRRPQPDRAGRARSSPCSAPPAAARPRRCGWSPGWRSPPSGSVLLGDRDIARLRPYKRPVNTVFQSYALFPHLNIFENVAFGLRRRGVARRRRAGRRGCCRWCSWTGSRSASPAQLSGGQQQRVALARALINRPQVLLLDEPLGALDLKLRRQMQIELKRIQTEVGITFVHVTHDQEEAMTMADTVAVMNAGKIEQLGAPADLYEYPGDRLRGQLPRPVQPAGRRGGRPSRRRRAAGRRTAPASRCPPSRSRADAGRRSTWGYGRRSCICVGSDDGAGRPPVRSPAWSPTSPTWASARSTCVRTGWGTELSVFAANSGTATPLPVGARGRRALAPAARVPARRASAGRRRPRRRRCSTPDASRVARHDRARGRRTGRGTRDRRHRRRPVPRRRRLAAVPPAAARRALAGRLLRRAARAARRDQPLRPDRLADHRLRDDLGVRQLPGRAARRTGRSSSAPSATPGIATVLALLLGYPLAYAIAQKAGRWKNLLLVCVVAPLFTSFLVRTLAWKTILSDNGCARRAAARRRHLLGDRTGGCWPRRSR